MKRVSATTQNVFDDPLFCPGDSFKPSDSDDYVAPLAKPAAVDLVNTLTISDEESFLSKPKPMQTKKLAPKPVVSVEQQRVEAPAEKPLEDTKAVQKKKNIDPLHSSNYENDEGENLFLPASGQEKVDKYDFEEELFGKTASSSSPMQPVKLDGINLRLGTHDSDSDNEIGDLGVGAIMEREVLDFDLFGKSSVRQYEPMETDDPRSKKEPTTTVGKDDLVLESNDILSDFESMLLDTGAAKKTSLTPAAALTSHSARAAPTAEPVVVDNSYDIDAYISQQEEDGGGGLFD